MFLCVFWFFKFVGCFLVLLGVVPFWYEFCRFCFVCFVVSLEGFGEVSVGFWGW